MNTQLKKGILEMIVLHFLSKRNYYAYELNKALNEVIETNESTTYVIFKKLVDKGFCKHFFEQSSTGPMRKCYMITFEGLEELKIQKMMWKEINEQVSQILEF